MQRVLLLVLSLTSFALSTFAAVPDCAQWVSQRDFAKIAWELHGESALAPSPESLLGRYLAASGAQTIHHRFSDGVGGFGPEKLVVAVSEQTFPLFRQLFGETYPNLLEHLHTPAQGTLHVRWMTQVFRYGSPSGGDWRFPQVGSIGPMILLSDSEALRLQSYWRLNEQGVITCRTPNQIPGYGYPEDAYIGNCTAWFGHIPLGDATYQRVVSAGAIDRWGVGSPEPRWSNLQDYVPQNLGNIDHALLKEVWSPDLHLRLWDLLGIPFELANHTNPGWVAISLTALAKPERVPFVAAYVTDHRQIPLPFNSQIAAVGP